MSVYLKKGKGWRYDFTLNGQRYTQAWFPTKTAAKDAESDKRKEVKEQRQNLVETPTDMGFLELVNRRLDHIKSYNSEKHYTDSKYMAKRWIQRWRNRKCREISEQMIRDWLLKRKKVSGHTANKELRFLRATFNFGKKRKWITQNPTDGIEFFPVDKKVKYVPGPAEIDKVIAVAKENQWLMKRYPDTPDYLEMLRDTLARMSEMNRLKWDDVDFKRRFLVLYTRKIDGGLTPRQVPMTDRVFEILSERHARRNDDKPWVFWNPRTGRPYRDRKRIMKSLCKKAEVPYFRFHSLRHASASMMDNHNVPSSAIQKILGHKNRSTTEIYLHSLGDAERNAIRALEQARTGKKSHTESHTRIG